MDELKGLSERGEEEERMDFPAGTDQRLKKVERLLMEAELEASDFQSALRRLLGSMGAVLKRGWAPKDIDEVLKNTLLRIDGGRVTPEIVEEFSRKLAGHLEVRDAGVTEDGDPTGATVFRKEGFLLFLEDVATLKGSRYQEEVRTLVDLIKTDASLNIFLPLLNSFLLRLIKDTKLEREELSAKLSAIIRSLLNVEKQFRDYIDKSLIFIGEDNREFSRVLNSHLEQIQDAVANSSQEEYEKLLNIISDEVNHLSNTIKEKNIEDEKLMELLSVEKVNLKSNLADVTRDYSNFVKQSTQLLKELEIIKSVALRDALTGIYNRRAYDEQLFLTLVNFKSGKLSTFSLIIFDIDYFRNVNNYYGHQAGDLILAGLAKVLVSTLRSDDFIFRYGGDEFVVILPNSPLEAGAKVAEKIRASVEAHSFPIAKTCDDKINITISVGVAQSRPDDTSETILKRADKALYAAKEGGRNRVATEEKKTVD
ncbi:MAG: diguanylate cyclase [Deltaproteobacteria bacterium]|jgi:diguanylate cyclase (GGDEF)-like protein|nr:diguanylate cyclase [Deltaproteobacteria bacterium]